MLKVLEVVLKAPGVVLYVREILNGVRCVRWFILCMPFFVLFYMLLCISGGCGGRAPFARGTRVMRFVPEAEKDVQHVL